MSATNQLMCDRCAREFEMLGDFARDIDIRFVNYTRGSIGSTWIHKWDLCPDCTTALRDWVRSKNLKAIP